MQYLGYDEVAVVGATRTLIRRRHLLKSGHEQMAAEFQTLATVLVVMAAIVIVALCGGGCIY
jgi:hypothetical protein